MKCIVVRHGQVNANQKDLMVTLTDMSLNEVGKAQARKTREKIKNLEYDRVICSPLKRARETLEIIHHKKDVPIVYDKRIVERDCGSLEGKSIDTFDYDHYWNYKKNVLYEGALSIRDFYQRIFDFLEDIKDKYKGETLLIVTHNGVCRAIHTYFYGLPEDGNTEIYSFENAEVRFYETK